MKLNADIPFQSIPNAAKLTGLGIAFLRNGCKDGTVPHIKSGVKYLVNMPALLRQYGAITDESDNSAKKDRPSAGTLERSEYKSLR